MSDEDQTTESRRSVLKKSAVATTAAVGGLAASASAASAESSTSSTEYINIRNTPGYRGGEYKIVVEADSYEFVRGDISEIIDNIEKSGDFLVIEGSFFGDKNCRIAIQGYGDFFTEYSEDGVTIGTSF